MTMNQNKLIFSFQKRLNNLMLILCACALVIGFFLTNEKPELDTPTVKLEPYQVAMLDDGSKEYFFDLSSFDSHYSGFMFYTSHQYVKAYNAGREIYSFTHTGGILGSTPGSAYNFISVNEKMLNVAIIIKPVYDCVKDQVPTFYVGNAYQMYDNLLRNSLPKFCASFLIVIFSLIILIYYAFMNKRLNLGRELVHLAYFALFIGTWTLNETDLSVLLFNNKIFDAVIPYLCLMMVIAPFVLFFDGYLGINGKIVKRIIVIASMVEFVVFTTLHLLKILEYREALIYMQILILAAAIYVVSAIVIQLYHRDFSRQTKICAIGVLLLTISIIIDVRNYYNQVGDSDKMGRYMFLIFVSLLAWDLIKGTNEIIEKGRHAKQLEVFALTDTMTGLYNRNAFESHVQSEDKLDGIIAVVADANGLKACNDTYGHEAGDEYITLVAEMFNSVFGRYGNCYRTGGDEFCCIIPASKAVNMERLKKLFMTKIYTANIEGGHQYSIGVAIGAAAYDSSLDSDFRALVKRADACMYENKKACKCL